MRAFLQDQDIEVYSVEHLQKAESIDFSDGLIELVPEAYLDDSVPSSDDMRAGMEEVIRDAVAYLVKSGHEDEVTHEKGHQRPL